MIAHTELSFNTFFTNVKVPKITTYFQRQLLVAPFNSKTALAFCDYNSKPGILCMAA